MNIIPIEALPGYDKELEELRREKFEAFMTTEDNDTKRERFFRFASVTSLRNAEFITALEHRLGLYNE